MASSTDLFRDIWGSPGRSTSPKSPASAHDSPLPRGRSVSSTSSRLFHPDAPDSDSEHPSRTSSPSAREGSSFRNRPAKISRETDALLASHDDDDARLEVPLFDMEKLAKEAEARHARALASSRRTNTDQPASATTGRTPAAGNSARNPLELLTDDEDDAPKGTTATDGKTNETTKKKRKPLPKLDEGRLLGKDGFPALIPVAKKFKPKGKGHEAADLARVLEMYQLWAHRMYPKTRFRDTIERVEKLCHTRRMTTSLSVWRDEDKHGPMSSRPDAEEPAMSGAEESDRDDRRTQSPRSEQRTSTPPMRRSTTSQTSAQSEADDAEMDEIMASMARQQGRRPEPDGIDDDMWDMADEANNTTSKQAGLSTTVAKGGLPEDDDEALWAGMAGDDAEFEAFMNDAPEEMVQPAAGDLSSNPPSAPPIADTTPAGDAMDVDGQQDSIKRRRQSLREEFEAGWDEMYE